MKKTKLISYISILILLCMMSSMFMTSCNSGGTVNDLQANRKALTITLYTIVEDSTTPEALALVEKELSAITQSKYTTKLVLIGLKKSEYEAEITRLFQAYDADQEKQKEEASIEASKAKASKEQARKDKAAGITQAPTKKPTEPPKTTELYTERIEYPKVAKDQLDIFLINSSDMFYQLASGKFAYVPKEGATPSYECRLVGMDDELNTKAKVLKEYLHPSVLTAGQFGDKTVAIATNKMIGAATYIAINKRLADAFNAYVEKFNADAEEFNKTAEKNDMIDKMAKLDFAKVKEYQHLTEYLAWVKANEPGVALIEGPFVPLKNFDLLFPDMPDFPIVASAGKTPVYTPEQPPTEPPTKAPTAPPTDDDGNLITADPNITTTIPPTTNKPKPTPAQTVLSPDKITLTNKFSSAAYNTIVNLNNEFRSKGLFETAAIPADKERAAFIVKGTLEDKMRWEATDLYGYEYIMYGNPIASKSNLQSSMYAISVSSKITTMRCMEIITLLNTSKQFKNIFQYGKEKVHFIYNDNGEIERISEDYMINMDYTGNHFIADLMAGENPNKWQIAQQHNLTVVNSPFLKFYLDLTKLTPADEEAIPVLNELGKKFNQELMSGIVPWEYADIDTYIEEFIIPALEDAGSADLVKTLKEQTNPPTD